MYMFPAAAPGFAGGGGTSWELSVLGPQLLSLLLSCSSVPLRLAPLKFGGTCCKTNNDALLCTNFSPKGKRQVRRTELFSRKSSSSSSN